MTNRGRVLKALRAAKPRAGLTVAQITERDLAGKLTHEKTELALEQLFGQAQVEPTPHAAGHWRLPVR